jgi:hypothetical protein
MGRSRVFRGQVEAGVRGLFANFPASRLSFFLGFTDSLVQLQERSRLLAVGYGRKSAASGQWCTAS